MSAPGVKISELPAANAANDTDQLEVNQGGVTRRVTLDQLTALVNATLPASGAADVRLFGVDTDGVQSPPAGLQAAIDWALAAPDSRELYLAGDVWLSADVTNLHEVEIRGPGTIRIGAGPKWHVDASFLNTGVAPLTANILFVNSTTGADTASGLSDVFPVASVQRAQIIVGRTGSFVQGSWEIHVGQCVLPGDGIVTFSDAQGPHGAPILVKGPAVAAWNNTTPPREPVAITAITSATPPVVSAAAHGYSNGETVFIGLARAGASAHGSDGKMYLVAGAAAGTFQLDTLAGAPVNGSGWAAYTGSGKVYDCNGSAPKAIVYGDGTGDGFLVQGDSAVWFYDFHFINCGTRAGGASSGVGVIARWGAKVRTFNLHATDCGSGVLVRDGSHMITEGGRYLGCRAGAWAIDSRFSFGSSNPGSNALSTTPIYKANDAGVDIIEGANGHADGSIFENNAAAAIRVRVNTSYCVAVYNRYINSTGGDLVGVLVEHGGMFVCNDGNPDIWTGAWKPRIKRLDGHVPFPNTGATRMNWLTTQRYSGGTPIVPAGGEQTIFSVPISPEQFNFSQSALRFKLSTFGTSAVGNVVFRIKVGDPAATPSIAYTTLMTLTVPAAAGVRVLRWAVDMGASGFNNWRTEWVLIDKTATTTTTPAVFSSNYTVAANQNIVVTGEVVDPADTCEVRIYEVERLGW